MNLESGCYDLVEIWPNGEQTPSGMKYCGQEIIPLQSSSENRLM